MICRNTRSLPSNSRNSPLQWLLNEKQKSHWPMSQDEIKIVKFKQELPPQWFVLLIGPDIFSVTTWIPTTDFNTATSPSPIIMIIVHQSSGLSFYVDGSLKLMWVETDGWKKAGPSHSDYCASRYSSPWLFDPQLKSGGVVSNKKNITDFFVQWFLR